jgi:tetrahydromethanopterin S-methyltransferase subunit A
VVATGGAGTIVYAIIGGNVGGAFAINSNTGRVTVNGALNFETRTTYTLQVRATSSGTTVNGVINLVINIADINEMHMFVTSCARTPQGCMYNLNENLPSRNLGRVEASDPDSASSPNGTLRYALSQGSLFAVDSSGNIRTTQELDREIRDAYTFTLTVSDRCGSGCSLSIQTTIRVTVNDLNDNPPIYTASNPRIELAEGTTGMIVAARYRATDADAGDNAAISYALTASPTPFPFTLSASGNLVLVGELDFETTESYMITVTASNPGNVFPTPTNTLIQVLNINDNNPMFIGAPYTGAIDENSPAGTPLLTVEGSDADRGIHGEIRFSIIGSGNFNNSFRIGGQNGAISVQNNIDRETISAFMLQIRVRDRGTPQQRSATTTIPVTVRDVNDNAPIFQPDSYAVQIREDAPRDSSVVQVTASDADEPGNPNSQIQYAIASGNEMNRFRINAASGEIQLMNLLDFEMQTSYSLTIVARDGGTPTMSGSATVSIAVINVNENPPTLTGDQLVNISESAPTNSLVAVFDALDPDQMPVTFTIEAAGNEENRFQIGSSSGEITLRAMLDFETTTRYNLGIRASDGQQTTSAMLTVIVLDVNEFPPVFNGDTAFMITEEQPNAVTNVGRVMATDDDRNDVVSYSFLTVDRTSNLFNLDSQSGQITTRSTLDREALTQVFTPPRSTVTVAVVATDNGSPPMRAERNYDITLLDINDNSPVFSDTSYANTLEENIPPADQPVLVFPASASDADLGVNAEITYTFTVALNGGQQNPFSIDMNTGAITTVTALDCELQSSYSFNITATDQGTPSRATTTTGTLTVQDKNDNPPIFNMPIYHVSLPENSPPEVPFLTVEATDADKGVNGLIRYRIMQENTGFILGQEGSGLTTQFRINEISGAITNINEFDFESASQINITVFADDQGVPQLTGMAVVVLNITNVDERAPFFVSSSCNAMVSEDIPVGEFVVRCIARDLDSTAAAGEPEITYSFTSENSFFEINSTSGAIRTRAPLDRETAGGHSATIIATDTVGGTDMQRVIILVSDVNDEAPVFQNTPYNFAFTRSTVGSVSQLLTVSAQDRDLGQNGTFALRIGAKEVDSAGTETRIIIEATDFGTPPMSSSETVTVTFEEQCQLQSYSISDAGELSVALLCSVEVTPLSLPLVIGGEKTVTCTIVSNTDVDYQWLHNSSSITSPAVTSGGQVTFTVTDAQFSDAGDYACLASSSAGSLQTVGATASIQGEGCGVW